MLDILKVILPTFLTIFVGFLIGRYKKWDMSVIVDIAIYVGLPALTFTSMLDKKIVLLDASHVWASALMIQFGCGLIALLVFTALKQKHSGLYIPIMLMNTVNIPFPIILLAFGSAGLFAATLFYIPNVILMYTLGVFLASGKKGLGSIKEILKVPPIYAAILGLIFNFANVHVPQLVLDPLNFIGMIATPLVLIVLGSNLAHVKITSLPTTLIASFIRLGFGLGIGFLAVNLFHLTGIIRSVVILDSAMPAAVNGALLTTKYKNEADLVSSVVMVTTLASLVMIPFLLIVLK
jgi:predicted permease